MKWNGDNDEDLCLVEAEAIWSIVYESYSVYAVYEPCIHPWSNAGISEALAER